MLSVKLLDDYIIKSQDIKTFKIQLLRDGKPHAIPADCSVTLLIATTKTIVKEETMKIVDAGEGIVEFTLHATIGVGSFDCEFILSNNDDINLTFPDNGFTVLKISPCLSERPIEEVAPSEYARLNERMDGFILELDTFESEVELLLAGYEEEFEDMQNEFNADIAALNTANQTFKNEMIANVGTYEDRIAHIENSVTATETLIDKVNALPDNAGNFVEVTKVQGNTLQNLCVNERTYSPQYCQMSYDSTGTYATVASLDSTSKGNMVMTFDSNLLKPNTKYTMIFREIYHVSNRILLRDVDSATNLPLNLVENNMCTFTTLATTSNYYRIYYYSLEVGEKVRIKDNVIVLEGDWTNRTDIPDFFTGIQSVDSVQVKSVGKNLFDCNKTLVYTNAIKIQEGLPYEAIFPEVSSSNRCRQRELIGVLPNKSYTLTVPSKAKLAIHEFDLNKCHLVDRGWSTATTSFITTENTRYIFIYMSMNGDSSFKLEEMKKLLKGVQLEENEAATAYEPYQETIMQIPLEEPLRSLPNGVCDSIEDGKIVRNVGKITIDSTHEYIGHLNNDNYISIYFEFKDSFENIKDMENALCNKLPVYAWSTGLGSSLPADKEVLWHHHASSFGLSIEKSKLTDVSYEGAFNYIVANNYEIYAQLKTPIIEDLPIPNDALLQTYQNGHILLESTPVNPKVDVQYAIGLQGKINKLETEMAENEQVVSNINSEIRNMLANETGLQTVTERVNDLVMQDGNIKLEEMQGNTVQNLTSQLKYFYEFVEGGGAIKFENSVLTLKRITLTGGYFGAIGYAKDFGYDESKEYTVVFDVTKNTFNNTVKFNHFGSYASFTFRSINIGAKATGRFAFKLYRGDQTLIDTSYFLSCGAEVVNETSLDEEFVAKVMLLEGDWTGKEIPAYFTGIKSVNEEQTGLQVRSVGKNLFNIDPLVGRTMNGVTLSKDDDGFYVLNGTCTQSGNFQIYGNYLKAGIYSMSANNDQHNNLDSLPIVQVYALNGSSSIACLDNRINSKHEKISMRTSNDYLFRVRIEIGKVYNNYRFKPQLELNEVATDYEPYKESAITIPYAEPLRKLPNGVCDTVEDGKVIRRVGKKVFDGSEAWALNNTTYYNYGMVLNDLKTNGTSGQGEYNVFCDKLCITDHSNQWDGTVPPNSIAIMEVSGGNKVYIQFDKTAISLPEFKQKLANDPITLYYELITPIIEEIPEITLAGYKHLIFDNDIVPTSATVSFANSNYARLVATEKATASQSSTIADLCAVTDYVVLQNGQQEEAIANISNVINSTINTLVNDAFKDTDMQTYWNSI